MPLQTKYQRTISALYLISDQNTKTTSPDTQRIIVRKTLQYEQVEFKCDDETAPELISYLKNFEHIPVDFKITDLISKPE